MPISLVGMVRPDHRNFGMDDGLDAFRVVGGFPAAHLYAPVGRLYYRHQWPLLSAAGTLHDAGSTGIFSTAFPDQRRVLVVF